VRQNNVLIIDEAQNLSPGAGAAAPADQPRDHERKLLQIILIGQPELRAMLARLTCSSSRSAWIARYHLEALTEGETAHYVSHR